MALTLQVQSDHAPVNNYDLIVEGIGVSIYFVELSGIELEIQTVDMPDRTKVAGGQQLPQEFTGMTMLHHATERAALEGWLGEAQAPVSPTYKKNATLIHKKLSGTQTGKYALQGLFIMKRKLPDLAKDDEGNPAKIEWSFSCDFIKPIGAFT